jgi:hypothetical protein
MHGLVDQRHVEPHHAVAHLLQRLDCPPPQQFVLDLVNPLDIRSVGGAGKDGVLQCIHLAFEFLSVASWRRVCVATLVIVPGVGRLGVSECLVGIGLCRTAIERAAGGNIDRVSNGGRVRPVASNGHRSERAPSARYRVEHLSLVEDAAQFFAAENEDLAF